MTTSVTLLGHLAQRDLLLTLNYKFFRVFIQKLKSIIQYFTYYVQLRTTLLAGDSNLLSPDTNARDVTFEKGHTINVRETYFENLRGLFSVSNSGLAWLGAGGGGGSLTLYLLRSKIHLRQFFSGVSFAGSTFDVFHRLSECQFVQYPPCGELSRMKVSMEAIAPDTSQRECKL